MGYFIFPAQTSIKICLNFLFYFKKPARDGYSCMALILNFYIQYKFNFLKTLIHILNSNFPASIGHLIFWKV